MAYDSLTGIANRHDFDKTLTVEYDNDQTGATIFTPTSGRVAKIVGIYVGTEQASSGSVRIFFSDDENDQENTVYKVYAADENPGYIPLVIRGDRNAVLKVTSDLGVGQNYFILVNYKEE